jgi:AcrR family transcriptional regulator
MPYRTTDLTRHKKANKRTAIMQAAVHIFAEKGYYAATVRDVVAAAGVGIGTFYFHFPDKETLFTHLYDETADFLIQALSQAFNSRNALPQQIGAALQSYLNIAIFEPAVIQLLLVGGVGALPELAVHRADFRERLVGAWQRPLDLAAEQEMIVAQNTRRTAEALAGAADEVVLNVLNNPRPEAAATEAIHDLTDLALRAAGYKGGQGG